MKCIDGPDVSEAPDKPTYRERREARAEKLRQWAEKRRVGVEAVYAAQAPYRDDIAFNTQPGRIPVRDRMNRRMERAWESTKTAQRMEAKASTIEAAADRAIYSDDPDAAERLRERIAGLEAERDQIKAYNRTCRKGARDLSLLTEEQKRMLANAVQFQPHDCKGGAMPAWTLTNLTGNIRRLRGRLEAIETAAERTATR